MRRFALIACCFTAFSIASAQEGGKVRFGLHANAATINVGGPLKDVYGGGYGGGAHLDFTFLLWSVRLTGDYIRFSPDNDKYRNLLNSLIGGGAGGFAVSDGEISIVSGGVNAKAGFLPIPILSPYITGGLGLARLGVSEAKVTQNGTQVGSIPGVKSETKTSANIGAGVDLSLGVTLYIEAKYSWIFTEGETSTYVPVSLGITF